jgi:hypothetical protein
VVGSTGADDPVPVGAGVAGLGTRVAGRVGVGLADAVAVVRAVVGAASLTAPPSADPIDRPGLGAAVVAGTVGLGRAGVGRLSSSTSFISSGNGSRAFGVAEPPAMLTPTSTRYARQATPTP